MNSIEEAASNILQICKKHTEAIVSINKQIATLAKELAKVQKRIAELEKK